MKVAQNVKFSCLYLMVAMISYTSSMAQGTTFILSGHDFFNGHTVSLDSNWVFYWQSLLSPAESPKKDGLPLKAGLSSWTTLSEGGVALPSFGYGTYKTRVILPHNRPSMAIQLPKIFSAAKIWVNDKVLLEIGRIGKGGQSTQHRRFNVTLPIPSDADTLDIVIQASNYYHSKGGLTAPPILGSTYALWQKERTVLISDMVFVGSLLFIGISFLALFLFYWNKDKAILYFAILCICWGYRNLSDGYAPLVQLFEWLPWKWNSKIEYIALFIGGLMGNLFLNSIFKYRFHALYPKLNTWFIWALVVVTLILPSYYYTYLLAPFFVVMLVDMCYAVVRLVGLVPKSGSSALALVAIFLAIAVLTYHIYTYNILGSTTSVWVSIGYVVVFMLNSLLLGKRFSLSFSNLKHLQARTLEQNQEISSQAEMLNRINNVLEDRVAERTQNLEQLAKELDILLYRSSHDLKRPVSTISGLTKLGTLLTKDEEILDLFDKIEGSNQDMANLIKKLGQVMLIREHRIRNTLINIDEIFSELEQEIRGKIKKNEWLDLEFQCDTEVFGDAYLIKAILFQLLHNSAKWVDLEERPLHVQCNVTRDKYALFLEVVDNGPGLSNEVKEEIFEMYHVANDRIPGHGMGLYLVRKAVERLNGTIELHSIPDDLTKFKVKLPLNQLAVKGKRNKNLQVVP